MVTDGAKDRDASVWGVHIAIAMFLVVMGMCIEEGSAVESGREAVSGSCWLWWLAWQR